MSDLADGIYFNPPHENAPDFVLGSISMRPEQFTDWLSRQQPNEKGYVRLSVKRSKAGKIYVALDDYKPKETPQRPAQETRDDFDDDDASIPF